MQTHTHPDQEMLMAWRDGEIAGAEAASIETHIGTCASCGDFVKGLGVVSARLGAWQVESAAFGAPKAPATPGRRFRWVAAAAVVLALVSVPAWLWTSSRRGADGATRLSANIFLPGAVQAASLESGAAPRVTLTVFVDWQCPACATSYPEYFQLMKEYEAASPGQVALVIKDYPLSATCNTAVLSNHHPAACEAAAAVRMARARGRAEAMIGFLIGHVTPYLQPEDIRAAVTTMLGPIDFDAEYARELTAIGQDVSEGVARGIQFTPSIYVNGWAFMLGERPSSADLRAAIDAQLLRGPAANPCPAGMERMRKGGCGVPGMRGGGYRPR